MLFVVFSELMWKVVVGFVDIGRIVDQHTFNFLFINLKYLLFFLAFWWMLLQKRVVCIKFDFYVFIKEKTKFLPVITHL